MPRQTHAAGPTLDWLGIGAQKAGTSTLFRILQQHPQITLPPAKEAPLFDYPVFPADVSAYLALHFRDAPPGTLRGTITPEYMWDTHIATRVHEYLPELRIIVVLRDPAERAFSHYRMCRRKGIDPRTFPEAVERQVRLLQSGYVPETHDESGNYVWRGCYAPLLRPWIDAFGRDSVLVTFTKDLETFSPTLFADIARHLRITDLAESSLNVYSNVTPPIHVLSSLRRPTARLLERLHLLDPTNRDQRLRVAEVIAPLERTLARLNMTKPDEMDGPTRQLLDDFYKSYDLDLHELLSVEPPWRNLPRPAS